MVYDAPLSARITSPVHRRLRMLAALRDKPMSHLIDSLLDKELPSVAELVSLLNEVDRADATPEAAVATSPDTKTIAAPTEAAA